jgi:acid phosphatase type 7
MAASSQVRPAIFAAKLAALGLVMATIWSCGSATPLRPSPTPAATPSSSSAAASPTFTIPEATATPLPSASAKATVTTPKPGFIPGPGMAPVPLPQTPGPPPPAPDPTTVTIVAAGDIACDPATNIKQPADCDQAATADEIGQLAPTAVLTLGDNQYEDGTLAAFQSVFGSTWGRYLSIMYPAIGNHEYLTHGAAGYFAYFGLPPYYSFNLGDWHLVSLDSECSAGGVGGCGPGSAQEKWLLADLAAHPSLCTLVYWHEPRWSSGEHGDASQMTTIWADLVAAQVDVVLTGHNHDYERFVPLDANGKPSPTGTTEFVVGTGGKNHYGFVTAPLTGEVVRNDKSFGVIQMSLGPTGYSWKFVPAPTYTFTDSGSASCH